MKAFISMSWLFFIFMGASESALANEILRVKCVTEFPTTSYFLTESEDLFTLKIYHHNGTQYLPLFSGTITPKDLSMLEHRSQILQKMGEMSTVSFQKNECSNKGIYWKCSRRRPVKIGELESSRVYFRMSKKESTYDDDFSWKTTETMLSFMVAGEDITMNYSFFENDCR